MRADHEVCIVGKNRGYNELLAAAVERGLGYAGSVSPEVPALAGVFEVWELSPTILLVDDADRSARSQLLALLDRGDSGKPFVSAALLNVERVTPELRVAVMHGLKGVFFTTDTAEHVLKGIAAIAGGEVWVPREILAGAAADNGQKARLAGEEAGLTMREIEILAHIASGATNEQIAAKLFVSPHTVKTHVYNIFRKISVKNRLRATLWAAEHLHLVSAALSTVAHVASDAKRLLLPRRAQAVM